MRKKRYKKVQTKIFHTLFMSWSLFGLASLVPFDDLSKNPISYTHLNQDNKRFLKTKDGHITVKNPNTYVPVLVEHPNDPVNEAENIPPVKSWHTVQPVLWWAVIQEVQDVFGGERRLLKTPINEIHHWRIVDSVLKSLNIFYLVTKPNYSLFTTGTKCTLKNTWPTITYTSKHVHF